MIKNTLTSGRIPFWVPLILLVGIVCLAMAVFTVYRDRVREKQTIEQLFLQKGEMLIRMFGFAHRQQWLKLDHEDLNRFFEQGHNRDVLALAVTKADGTVTAFSEPLSILAPDTFLAPIWVADFLPNWEPKFKKSKLADGRKVFWVYRPLLSSVEMPKPEPPHNDPRMDNDSPNTHHKKPFDQKRQPPPWPPVIDLEKAKEQAIYLWIGFDATTFESATAAALRNVIIFFILIGLNLLTVTLASLWAMRFARTSAVTSEIVTRLPIGLILNDPQGRVQLVNPAALKIFGLAADQVRGRTLSELTNGTFPEDREATALERDVTFQGGLSPRLSVSCGPVTLRCGDEIGRVVLMADLGEIDRLKRELVKNERLARLFGIASGLAHNIRNPVGSIRGLAQHLRDQKPALAQEALNALELILNSTDLLSRTLDDFLDFANPEIKAQVADLAEIVTQLHQQMLNLVSEKTLTMHLSVPEGPVNVLVDRQRLQAAIMTLYLNAIEAVEGNPVSRPGHLEVTLVRLNTAKILLKISDNGPGFSAKQLETPFVPYFTTKPNKTGLGLPKANNITQAFDGHLQLANALEGGALVTMTLPLFLAPPKLSEMVATDLGQLLTEVHNQVAADPQTNNVDLTLELPDAPVTILVARNLLEEALFGLYFSAVRAMNQNPPDRAPSMSVSLEVDDESNAVITFSDNGLGFTSAQLRAPFEAVSAEGLSGAGRAVFRIRSIIMSHNGQIQLANRSERGALVTVKFPAASAAPD
ncbi:MAG: PAS domain S-box protein [Deltaproteobacteria bacterium]|jgi:two-component system sensor histidine kinase HydH|nr:PAS domain S-box protein [Deltaproteobacteria bacterium]